MANLKSSIKDVRRTRTRTIRNKAVESRLESTIKEVRMAATAEAAKTALTAASSQLDRASASGLMHWRTAARQKGRLAGFVNRKFPADKKK